VPLSVAGASRLLFTVAAASRRRPCPKRPASASPPYQEPPAPVLAGRADVPVGMANEEFFQPRRNANAREWKRRLEPHFVGAVVRPRWVGLVRSSAPPCYPDQAYCLQCNRQGPICLRFAPAMRHPLRGFSVPLQAASAFRAVRAHEPQKKRPRNRPPVAGASRLLSSCCRDIPSQTVRHSSESVGGSVV